MSTTPTDPPTPTTTVTPTATQPATAAVNPALAPPSPTAPVGRAGVRPNTFPVLAGPVGHPTAAATTCPQCGARIL